MTRFQIQRKGGDTNGEPTGSEAGAEADHHGQAAAEAEEDRHVPSSQQLPLGR